MAKMTDAQLKSLLGKLPKWMQESEQQVRKAGGKVNIPKKPVKTAGKKTVPAKLDWGKGVTKDKLAYINSDEAAMLKARRGDAPVRKVKGIPAYAEETVGPGGGGGGTGSKGGSGGSSAGAGTGAGTGGGGSSAPSNSGASSQDDKKSTKASAPSQETSKPTPSAAPKSAPPSSSFGPRATPATGTAAKDPTTSASAQASKVAAEAALKSVAAGSIANPTTGTAPKISDRVAPTERATPDSASVQGSDIFSGANSPLASAETPSYDRTAQDALNAEAAVNAAKTAAATPSTFLSASVPAGSPIAGPSGRYPGASSYPGSDPLDKAMAVANAATTAPSIGVNPSAYSSPVGPSQASALNADAMKNVFSGPANTTVAENKVYGKEITDRVPQEANFVDNHVYGPGMKYSADAPVGKQFTDRLDVQTPYGPASGEAISRMSPEDQARMNTMAQTPTYNAPAGPVSVGRNISGVGNYATAGAPENLYSGANSGQFADVPDQAPSGFSGKTRSASFSNASMPTTRTTAAPVSGNVVNSYTGGVSAPQPYGGVQAAIDAAGPRSVAAAAPTGVAPASISQGEPTAPISPVEQDVATVPSSALGEKMQKNFARVGNAVTPALNAVDDFLGRIAGSSPTNKSYSTQMANGADGSNGEVYMPARGGSNTVAGMASGSGGNKVGKVGLPPLPPYVNYQNIPGGVSTGVALPAASQPILDYINGGYADGGAIKPVTSYGIQGAPSGGLSPQQQSQPVQNSQPAQTPAAQPTTAAPNSNPWGLKSVGSDSATEASGTLPGGKYRVTGDGRIVPTYAGQDAQQIMGGWLKQQMDALRDNSHQMPNFRELFARLDSSGAWGGGNRASDTPTTGGEDPGTTANKAILTGTGTPTGGWSADKTGWKRGGYVNDSVGAALMLARMLRS